MAQKEYRHANVEVRIDGKTKFKAHTPDGEEETRSGVHITRLHVDKRLDCPDYFSVDYNLILRNALTFLDSIVEGQQVEIFVGYGPTSEMQKIFEGEITYIEPHFQPDGHSTLTIAGYERKHRLTRGNALKTWDDREQASIDAAQVYQDIYQRSGSMDNKGSDKLAVETPEETGPSFQHVPQLGVNDFVFLNALGTDLGLSKITIGTPKLTIVRDKLDGTNPHIANEVRFRLSTVKQVSRVEVRGWDPAKKKNIVGVAESPSTQFDGTPGHEATAKALYDSNTGRKLVVVNHPVTSKEEADALAQSLMDQLSMDFLTGEAEIEGYPELAAGDIVEFKQFGQRFDGKYLVTACQHLFIPEVLPYVCRLEVQRNAVFDPQT